MAFTTTGILLSALIFFESSLLDVVGLKDVKIIVPEAVKIGDSVTLACEYDLESVALYSIKWYRFDEEFYRFVPKESPPSIVFAVPHLDVDVSKSNARQVTLSNVEKETAGVFKCEVSADGPLFHTDIRFAKLIVADVPEEEPVLRTDLQKLTPGGKVRANCTTPGSYPRMNITWFLNDVEIRSSSDVQIHDSIFHYDALPGKETVRSTISIKATADRFKNSKMKVRCLATMFSLYSLSAEVELFEDAPQLALIMEPTATYANSAGNIINANKNYIILFLPFLLEAYLQDWLRRTS